MAPTAAPSRPRTSLVATGSGKRNSSWFVALAHAGSSSSKGPPPPRIDGAALHLGLEVRRDREECLQDFDICSERSAPGTMTNWATTAGDLPARPPSACSARSALPMNGACSAPAPSGGGASRRCNSAGSLTARSTNSAVSSRPSAAHANAASSTSPSGLSTTRSRDRGGGGACALQAPSSSQQMMRRSNTGPTTALRDYGSGGAARLAETHPEWEDFVDELNKAMEVRLGMHLKDCSKCRCFSAFSQKSGLKKNGPMVISDATLSSLCKDGIADLKRHIAAIVLNEKNNMVDMMVENICIGAVDVSNHEAVERHRFDETFASLAECSLERDRIFNQSKIREEMVPTLQTLCKIQVAVQQWQDLMAQGIFGSKGVPHRGSSQVTAIEVEAAGLQLLRLQASSARTKAADWEQRWQPATFEATFSLFGHPLFDLSGPASLGLEKSEAMLIAPSLPSSNVTPKQRKNVADARNSPNAALAGEVQMSLAGWVQNGPRWMIDLDDDPLQPEAISKVKPMTVVVRVRPPLEHEAGDLLSTRAEDDGQTISFKAQLGPGGSGANLPEQTLHFDGAIKGSQATLFSNSGVKALVHRAVEGFTSTVFAYGQTGAGKTFSLLGPSEVMGMLADDGPAESSTAPIIPEPCWNLVEAARKAKVSNQGLLPRCAQYLFKVLEEYGCGDIVVQASFVEVYNERVFDLLNPAAGQLDVRQRPNNEQGFYVPGRTDVPCRCPADLLRILRQGVAVRHTSGHSMSRESSRAHAIFNMELSLPGGKCGRLVFADLAGSERAKKIEGASMHETAAINKSLLMLSNCISALAAGDAKSSPSFASAFRNSKLTKMLMESLCGQGYTLLLAAISPAERHFDETANTLYFAAKCSNIRKTAAVNLSPHEKEVQALKDTIKCLRKELAEARGALKGTSVGSPLGLVLPPDFKARGDVSTGNKFAGSTNSNSNINDDEESDEEKDIEIMLADARRALEAERRRNAALSQENDALRREVTRDPVGDLPNQMPDAVPEVGATSSSLRYGLEVEAGTGGVDDCINVGPSTHLTITRERPSRSKSARGVRSCGASPRSSGGSPLAPPLSLLPAPPPGTMRRSVGASSRRAPSTPKEEIYD